MNRTGVWWLATGLCLIVAMGVNGLGQQLGTSGPTLGSVAANSPAIGSTVGQAVVPRLMKFSGALRDAAGKPLTGTVDVIFALYNTEVGGDALWFETQSVQADELGHYTALLGAMHADGLPTELFTSGQAQWLGIQVASEAEQQPRVLLVSVPYALKAGDAETLGGKPASAYMLSDSQNGTVSTAASAISATVMAQADTGGPSQKTRAAGMAALAPCSSVTIDGTSVSNTLAFFDTTCTLRSSGITLLNGKLGLGISTPEVPLHVFGPTRPDGDARFNLALGDSTASAAGVGGGILFSGYYKGTTDRAGFASIRGVKENSIQGDDSSALIFDTRTGGVNQAERMRITSAGNLGIGTATPEVRLHILGPTRHDGDARFNFALGDTTPAAAGVGGGITFTGYYGGTSLAAGFANIRGVKENDIQGDYASSLIFDTRVNNGAPTERMRITSAGNVGIGTSTPTAKLEVNGTAKFNGTVTFAQPISSNIATSSQLISTVATGTSPLTVTSTTQVLNLNASLLGGDPNSAFARAAFFRVAGAGNTVAGSDSAFSSNTTGKDNTAVGSAALEYNTTGVGNTATGSLALLFSDGGSYNSAFGSCALLNTYVNYGNTFGLPCGLRPTLAEGSGNTAVGYRAGESITRGKGNTFLGFAANGGGSNSTAIGANAEVGQSNAMVLGSINGVNGATSSVDVGIGTTTPTARLEVVGNVKISGAGNALVFPDGTVQTTAGNGSGTGGGGTITGVTAGVGLLGGGTAGGITLSLDTTRVPQLVAANTFVGNQSVAGNLQIGGAGNGLVFPDGTKQTTAGGGSGSATNLTLSGDINLAQTTSATVGVITMSGTPFIHACCGANQNTFVGLTAGNFSTSGIYNTATGFGALGSNTTGGANAASGWHALGSNTTGAYNTGIGYGALGSNTTGGGNAASGAGALATNQTGNSNTAIGTNALNNNLKGSFNTASGDEALIRNTANSNTGSGMQALAVNDTGVYNSAFGTCALVNTFGTSNGGATANVCNGLSTLSAGSGHTAVGYFSGRSNTTGQANTFLGFMADASSGTLTNATAIGAYAVVGESNALVLGSINGVNNATASVNVGIGTSTPAEPLHVASGDAYISNVGSGIILKSPDGLTCKRVTIDNSGSLVLTTLTCP